MKILRVATPILSLRQFDAQYRATRDDDKLLRSEFLVCFFINTKRFGGIMEIFLEPPWKYLSVQLEFCKCLQGK